MFDANHYRHTAPLSKALAAEFGSPFGLEHTGGGCTVVMGVLPGGRHLLVGSAVNGPLLTDAERADCPFQGGHGVGVYDDTSGDTLAYAADFTAVTGADVVAVARIALGLVGRPSPERCTVWQKRADGSVTETVERR